MIKGYKSSIRKSLKKSQQDLHKIIAKQLEKEGIVEVLAAIYLEMYYLKKQLMVKGHIEPEAAYLVGEVYEHFEKQDRTDQRTDDNNK